MTTRKCNKFRKTSESEISLSLNLDGEGKSNIDTGIGFLNHMLNLMTKHGFLDLDIKAIGDLEVDAHHTVEDIGIVLGKAFKEALGNKEKIKRYGTCFLTMDESLAFVSLDISGRAFLVYSCEFTVDKVGDMDTELVEEFLRAFAFNSEITLHTKILYGKNNHHMIEAIFKALGRAIKEAVSIDEKIEGVMSTKGII